MTKAFRAAVLSLALALLAAPGSARADYFFDQGFVRAPLRSDFADSRRGTAALPLREGACLFPEGPGVTPVCGTGRRIWPRSNWFSRGVGSDGRYWIVMANNEPWAIDTSGSGPPGQSLPIVAPGAGIAGFDALALGGAGSPQEAHLVLVNLFDNPHRPLGQYAIPFLSLIVDDDHGNGGVLGALNNPQRPHAVTWVSTLYDHASGRDPHDGSGNRGMWSHFFWVTSEWGGKPRMVFLNLMWNGITWSGRWRAGLHAHWNWPFLDSGLYPGGDIAYVNAGEIGVHCRELENIQPIFKRNTAQRYTVDLQALFRCASDMELFDQPMPATGDLPLRTMGWANEGSGWFFAWTSVRDMRMLGPTTTASAAIEPSSAMAGAAAMPPPFRATTTIDEVPQPSSGTRVDAIRATLSARCSADATCAAAHRERDAGAAPAPR